MVDWERGQATLLPVPRHLNCNKVVRDIKRQDVSLYNCLASISADAEFVAVAVAHHAPLPLVANLRCGAWYTEQPDETCYFKSTDGHSGNWGFSTVRLNWHVALLAARCGGAVIVDATRSSTKRFPDALAKTIPIWAAVLNAGVAAHRRAACAPGEAPAPGEWDSAVHLPPWVPEPEAAAVAARLPAWTEALLSSGADLAALAAALRKPLRPVWVSPASPLWGPSFGGDGGGRDGTSFAAAPFVPLVLLSASAPLLGVGRCRASAAGGDSWAYVPGAGDDEESWARGLTPALFWANRARLLGPGVSPASAALAAAEIAAACPANAKRAALGSSRGGAALPGDGQPRTASNLPPLGCRGASPLAPPAPSPSGVRWIGASRLGLASAAALEDSTALFAAADAVVHLDVAGPHLAFAPPHNAEADAAAGPRPPPTCAVTAAAAGAAGARYLWLPVQRDKLDRSSLQSSLPAAAAFAAAHLGQGRSVLLLCPDGRERGPAAAAALLCACFDWSDSGGAAALAFAGCRPPSRETRKDDLRRALALVASAAPNVRPSRGLLRQAFLHLRGGEDGPSASPP